MRKLSSNTSTRIANQTIADLRAENAELRAANEFNYTVVTQVFNHLLAKELLVDIPDGPTAEDSVSAFTTAIDALEKRAIAAEAENVLLKTKLTKLGVAAIGL